MDRATEFGRVLFSQDDDLLQEAARRQAVGVHFSGLIYTHQHRLSISQCIEELALVAEVLDSAEMNDRVEHRDGWSRRELERQLAGALFERVIMNPPQASAALKELHPEAQTVFRDTYLVEFLDLPERHLEANLHKSLLRNLRRFMGELGRDFCFIGSEVPLHVSGICRRLFQRGSVDRPPRQAGGARVGVGQARRNRSSV